MLDHELSELLSRFHEHFGSDRLTDVEERLCRELGADQVEFLDDRGRHLHRMIPFRQAFENARAVQVILPLSRSPAQHVEEDEPSPGNEQTAPGNGYQNVIRELDRIEQQKDANWAGFIVNTLLPQMGYSIEAARALLQRMEKDGVIHLFKRPNPRSPERPTTFVQLNRDSATVRSALAAVPDNDGGRLNTIRTRRPHMSGDIICGRR
jgi:hypothetical protein